MKELRAKIREALLSALPVTVVVYLLSLTPILDLTAVELIPFTVGAVLLVLGIGLFSLGADIAMTPMGTQVGSGLSRQKKLGLRRLFSAGYADHHCGAGSAGACQSGQYGDERNGSDPLRRHWRGNIPCYLCFKDRVSEIPVADPDALLYAAVCPVPDSGGKRKRFAAALGL